MWSSFLPSFFDTPCFWVIIEWALVICFALSLMFVDSIMENPWWPKISHYLRKFMSFFFKFFLEATPSSMYLCTYVVPFYIVAILGFLGIICVSIMKWLHIEQIIFFFLLGVTMTNFYMDKNLFLSFIFSNFSCQIYLNKIKIYLGVKKISFKTILFGNFYFSLSKV